ncbi:Rrf2 family transcriptional regulator [Schleiferiaceae bacterium]|jgi:Rrf2 family protein|nr:Rrf2 family transcriptional regulator [Schleiferiaceae bacterium]
MLNRKTYYGIQSLLFIARNKSEKLTPITEITESLKISRKFLEKILSELRHEGIVTSKIGRSGGYSISKDLDSISLADIVRILEGPIALLPCASHRFYESCKECLTPDKCSLQDALVGVRNDTVHSLKSIKIQDLLTKEILLKKDTVKAKRPTPYQG